MKASLLNLAARAAKSSVALLLLVLLARGAEAECKLDWQRFGCEQPSIGLGETAMAPSTGNKGRPHVASDGNRYLVVWQDWERNQYEAVLFDGDGKRLHEGSRVIGPGPQFGERPRDGHSYLVWDGADFVFATSDTTAVRRVLAGDTQVSIVPYGSALAASASRVLAYSRYRYGAQVFSDNEPTVRIPESATRFGASAASNGERFAVVWHTATAVEINIIDRSGATKWPEPVKLLDLETWSGRLPGYAPIHLSIAWNGREYVLLMIELRNAPRDTRIVELRADAEGTLLGQPRVVHQGAPIASRTTLLPLPGGELLAYWNEVVASDRDVAEGGGTGFTVGKLLSCDGAPRPLGPHNSAFATNNRTILRAHRATNQDVFRDNAAIVVTTTSVAELASCSRAPAQYGAEQFASLAVPQQDEPAVASAATETAVVWTERTGYFGSRVRGALVDHTTGRLIAPLRVPDEGREQWAPAIASDGRGFLAVWLERVPRQEVKAALLTADPFAPLETLSLGGMYAYYSGAHPYFAEREYDLALPPPGVSWNGTYYLAAWTDANGTLRVARITRDGKLLDPEGRAVADKLLLLPRPRNGTVEQRHPSLATDGERTLLAWYEEVHESFNFPTSINRSEAHVRAVVLDREGRPTGAPVTLSPHPFARFPSAVERDGSFVVVYTDAETELAEDQLRATVIARDGTAGKTIVLPLEKPEFLAVAWPRAVRIRGAIYVQWPILHRATALIWRDLQVTETLPEATLGLLFPIRDRALRIMFGTSPGTSRERRSQRLTATAIELSSGAPWNEPAVKHPRIRPAR